SGEALTDLAKRVKKLATIACSSRPGDHEELMMSKFVAAISDRPLMITLAGLAEHHRTLNELVSRAEKLALLPGNPNTQKDDPQVSKRDERNRRAEYDLCT